MKARTLTVPPTNASPSHPVELIVSASSSALWSAQRITFLVYALSASLIPLSVEETMVPRVGPGVTTTGVSEKSTTASEHVASKPMPLTREAIDAIDACGIILGEGSSLGGSGRSECRTHIARVLASRSGDQAITDRPRYLFPDIFSALLEDTAICSHCQNQARIFSSRKPGASISIGGL